MKIFYTTGATVTGGRSGTAPRDDGSFSVQITRPGRGDASVNPEQLFASGCGAYFDSAMDGMAGKHRLNIIGVKTTVEMGMGKRDEGGYALDLDITAYLPSLSALCLAGVTHQTCLYSNASRAT